MERNHILEEIRRTAKENGGKPLGRQRFLMQTGIRESDWKGIHWIRWNEAVREAGFEPNTMQAAFETDILLATLAAFVREISKFPVTAELELKARNSPSFPNPKAFRRLGNKAAIAAELLNWCKSRPGWDDVESICAPFAIAREQADDSETQNVDSSNGYVYLLRSGRYYKIGRSNAPGRRVYELAIQLPDPVTTVHTIKTDDPAGIEKYWHDRFASVRKNGEWFELRREDVSAFRRRKFM